MLWNGDTGKGKVERGFSQGLNSFDPLKFVNFPDKYPVSREGGRDNLGVDYPHRQIAKGINESQANCLVVPLIPPPQLRKRPLRTGSWLFSTNGVGRPSDTIDQTIPLAMGKGAGSGFFISAHVFSTSLSALSRHSVSA